MATSELIHEDLQSLFKEIHEATNSQMIEKSSVDFLEPYLNLVKKSNVVK